MTSEENRITVLVNGRRHLVPENATITDLLKQLSIKPEYIAVELNREIVKRNAWETTRLRPNDVLEIVHFVGGGKIK